MKQNNNCPRFLLLGVLLIAFCFLQSCGNLIKIDYIRDADWYYTNQTDSEISVMLGSGDSVLYQKEYDFSIAPGQTEMVTIRADASTDDIDASDYDPPYERYGAMLTTKGKEYTLESATDGGILDVNNYGSEKIRTNYFKFTYIFKDTDFE